MKRINRIWLVWCLLLASLLPGMAAGEAMAEDGLYTIGVQSNSRMFNIVKCVLHVEEGQMTAVITLSGDGYSYVYAGTAEEAQKPEAAWIPYVENWEGAYTYALPVDKLDEEMAVAAYSKRYSKWYDRTLVFHSSTLSPYREIAPDGVYTAVVSSDSARFNHQEVILTSRNGAMSLEMADGFRFELASLDQRIALEEDSWLMVRTESLKEHVVRAADGSYQAEVRTDSALLRFKSCQLKVENGRMTALLTAQNSSFAYLYCGTSTEAVKNEAEWIPAVVNEEGAYTYLLDIPSLDNEIAVATYSSKKKMWYDRTLYIDSSSLILNVGE